MCWRSARQGQLQCETSIFQHLDLTNNFNPQGDSGGPLIMQVTDITPYQLIGVVSGGTARWIKRTNINNEYFFTKYFSDVHKEYQEFTQDFQNMLNGSKKQ